MNVGRELTLDLGSTHLVVYSRRGDQILRERTRVIAPEPEAARRPAPARRSRSVPTDPEPTPPALPEVLSPVVHGRIVDAELLDPLLERLLSGARRGHWLSWAMRGLTSVIVPPVLDEEGRLRLSDLLGRHGLSPSRPVELSAALCEGCALDEAEPRGRMVIDLGGGKAYIATYSLGGVVAWHWAEVGGEDLDRALIAHVERRHKLRLSLFEAERVKLELGGVHPPRRPQQIDVQGRQTRSGMPDRAVLDDAEVRDVLVDGCEPLILAIQQGFREVPPEMASDIAQDGVWLAGGGALLRGLPDYLTERLGLRVHVVPDPINAAIRGAAALQRRTRRRFEAWGAAE